MARLHGWDKMTQEHKNNLARPIRNDHQYIPWLKGKKREEAIKKAKEIEKRYKKIKSIPYDEVDLSDIGDEELIQKHAVD